MSIETAPDLRTILIWIGTLLFFGGVLFTAYTAIWSGRFIRSRRTDSAAGFSLRANWPGLVMLIAGIICFLSAAAF